MMKVAKSKAHLNIQNFQIWMDVLRSGKYTQCRNSMRRGNSYCCLAVGCEVSHSTYSAGGGYPTFSREIQGKGYSFEEWLGLKREDVGRFYKWCGLMNDERELSFDEIAGALENYLQSEDTP